MVERKTRECDTCGTRYEFKCRRGRHCGWLCRVTERYREWDAKREPRKVDLAMFWYHNGEKMYLDSDEVADNLHAETLLYDWVGDMKVIVGYRHDS